MLKIIKSISVVCLFGVLGVGSNATFAYNISCPDGGAGPLNGCTLPGTGVVDGSYPFFDSPVNVTYDGKKLEKKDVWTMKARSVKGSGGTLFVSDTEQYTIDNMRYQLNAKVDGGGAYGTVRISGKIADVGKFKVTAFLNPTKDNGKNDKSSRGVWGVSEDNMFFGFNTYGIQCKGLESLFECTTAEVAFLNLLSPIGPFSDTSSKKVSTAGTEVTSVPLPAAAWLFGSGLLGLIAVSRRSGRLV
jgi:hypothetical protein